MAIPVKGEWPCRQEPSTIPEQHRRATPTARSTVRSSLFRDPAGSPIRVPLTGASSRPQRHCAILRRGHRRHDPRTRGHGATGRHATSPRQGRCAPLALVWSRCTQSVAADEEPVPLGAAEGDVGDGLRGQDLAEQHARRIVDVDAVAGARPDVAVSIDAEAVGHAGIDVDEDACPPLILLPAPTLNWRM